MRALIEKVIRAIAMAEVIELPRLCDSTAIPNRFLVNKHFDGPKISCEILSIGITCHSHTVATASAATLRVQSAGDLISGCVDASHRPMLREK